MAPSMRPASDFNCTGWTVAHANEPIGVSFQFKQYAQSALTACGQGCSSAQTARAHMYIGVAQARLGNTAEMAAEFKQAVEQEPALVLDPSISDDATQRAFQEASNHARVQPPASP